MNNTTESERWLKFYEDLALITSQSEDEMRTISRALKALRSFVDASQVLLIEVVSKETQRFGYLKATNRTALPLENVFMTMSAKARTMFMRYFEKNKQAAFPRRSPADYFSGIEKALLSLNRADSIIAYSIYTEKELAGVVLVENPRKMPSDISHLYPLEQQLIKNITSRNVKRAGENKTAVLNVLSSNYELLAVVDFDQDITKDVFIADRIRKNFDRTVHGERFSERIKIIAEEFVPEGFRKQFLRAASKQAILAALEKEESYRFNFPAKLGKSLVYRCFSFVRDTSSPNSNKVIMEYLDINDTVKKKKEIESIVTRQDVILQALSADYEDVHLVDIVKDRCSYLLMSKYFYENVRPFLDLKGPYTTMLKKYAESFVIEEDRELFLNMLSPAMIDSRLENGGKIEFAYRMLKKENHVSWMECKIVRENSEKAQERLTGKQLIMSDMTGETLESDGVRRNRGSKVVVGYRNIDKQKKAELEYAASLEEAKRKAEQASRSKTTFLLNMSHDIRTPMNAILGFSDMVERHIDSPEYIREDMKKVKTAGDQLMRLINDVLDMARIESGKTVLNLEPVDISRVVRDMLEGLALTATHGHVKLSTDFSCVENLFVLADRARFERIILNIVSNAIKYTPQEGSVHVSLSQIKKRSTKNATYKIEVTDTGIGMSKEYLAHIYEPFSRAESTTLSGVQGAGLGMSITKSLIEKMGGSIDIESEPNKGTDVIVVLTFEKCGEPKKTVKRKLTEEKLLKELQGERVLLVEDNELNREIAISILEEVGIEVDVAINGQEAVEKVEAAEPFDYRLILMDIQMPIMDGYEATRRIRKLQDTKKAKIPILAMTANAFEEDRRKALECGMDEHMAKPIDMDKLYRFLLKYRAK